MSTDMSPWGQCELRNFALGGLVFPPFFLLQVISVKVLSARESLLLTRTAHIVPAFTSAVETSLAPAFLNLRF
jgi:hypothetical protein